jgi:hypothetical protein
VRETTIASFVLRFIQEAPADAAPPARSWRGIVRHVQTGEETPFTRIEDALAFIGRYVNLGTVEHAGQEED